MSVISGDAAPGRGGTRAPSRPSGPPERASAAVPQRADGVQLIGEMQGSGYREPPALVRRADGQVVQLTPLLYLVLRAVDGRRSEQEVAATVSAAYGRGLSADNVSTLVDTKLRPLGLLRCADGSEPELKRSNPLLVLRLRFAVTDPDTTRRLTAPFADLFRPLLVVPLVATFLAISWWVLFDKGLASATRQAFDRPGLLLLIFVVTVLSAGFHEFGHAAAARYGGSTPGVMGFGVYLVWPAFYTDVTDSYRLGRAGRICTDLGGLYFNAIVAVGVAAAWWTTGFDALLLVVATQIMQMVRQLAPLVRFDGYHLLADITGVPDLFHRIVPTLRSMLPWRWAAPESKVLKPWARVVVTAWVAVVVPLLVGCLAVLVVALPRVVGTAWVNLQEQWGLLGSSWLRGDLLEAGVRILSLVALAFPILGFAYLLVRLVRQVAGTVRRWSAGRPGRRVVAAVCTAAVVTGLAWAWWPGNDTYRPIQPYEQGTVLDAVPMGDVEAVGVLDQPTARAEVVWPTGTALPTAEDPQLAMVLVPRQATPDSSGGSGTSGDGSDAAGDLRLAAGAQPASDADGGTDATPEAAATSSPTGPSPIAPAEAPTWVFPFDRPAPPAEGDNQALAVNTEDDSVQYDVAFALVWADGDTVLNTNEAYAFASCRDCTTVAVAFQVVLVVGQADVVVPQNLSGALNYECLRCLTYALASQLVVTPEGPLSTADRDALDRLWAEIEAFADRIEQVPLSQLRAQLEGYKQRVLQILDGAASTGSTDAASVAVTEAPTAQPTDNPTPTAADGSAAAGPSGADPADPAPADADTDDDAADGASADDRSMAGPTASAAPTAESSTGEPQATASPSPEQSTVSSPTPSTSPSEQPDSTESSSPSPSPTG